MFFSILIVVLAIVALLALHEMGHFLIAKKLGVKVEEFGIGYPPRLWGKKIGETIYSLNLIPFGAFVRILGESEKVKNKRSFSEKTVFQRALIILGGVVAFWIIAILIMILVIGFWGLPAAVPDNYQGEITNPHVEIIQVFSSTPASEAGLESGDEIIGILSSGKSLENPKEVGIVQNFIKSEKEQELELKIKRGENLVNFSLVPRVNPPENEGAIGISLAKVGNIKYSWYEAPLQGLVIVGKQTAAIPIMLGNIFFRALEGEKLEGVQFSGPIGISQMLSRAIGQGWDRFLLMISLISIWLALFNIFPIPALDGGKLLFLIIEGIRKKPISEVLERKVSACCFLILLGLMVLVTIFDITRIFNL